jgi:hypothetical protein
MIYLAPILGFIRDHRDPRITLLPAAQPRVWGFRSLLRIRVAIWTGSPSHYLRSPPFGAMGNLPIGSDLTRTHSPSSCGRS